MATATDNSVVVKTNAEKAAEIKAEKVTKAKAEKAAADATKSAAKVAPVDAGTCTPKDAVQILRDSWTTITAVRLGKNAVKFASTLRDKAIVNPRNFADWAKEVALRIEGANTAYRTLRTLAERKDGQSLNIELCNSKNSDIKYVGMTPARLLAAIQRDEAGILSCDIAR